MHVLYQQKSYLPLINPEYRFFPRFTNDEDSLYSRSSFFALLVADNITYSSTILQNNFLIHMCTFMIDTDKCKAHTYIHAYMNLTAYDYKCRLLCMHTCKRTRAAIHPYSIPYIHTYIHTVQASTYNIYMRYLPSALDLIVETQSAVDRTVERRRLLDGHLLPLVQPLGDGQLAVVLIKQIHT